MVALIGTVMSSALLGGAGEVVAVEEAGWCCLTEYQNPRMDLCPGPAGNELEMRSGGEVPRVEGLDGEHPGLSGGERGEAGWLGDAAGLVEEE